MIFERKYISKQKNRFQWKVEQQLDKGQLERRNKTEQHMEYSIYNVYIYDIQRGKIKLLKFIIEIVDFSTPDLLAIKR